MRYIFLVISRTFLAYDRLNECNANDFRWSLQRLVQRDVETIATRAIYYSSVVFDYII